MRRGYSDVIQTLMSQIQGVREEVPGGVQLDVLQLPLFLRHGLGGPSVGTPGPFNLGVLDSSLPILCCFAWGTQHELSQQALRGQLRVSYQEQDSSVVTQIHIFVRGGRGVGPGDPALELYLSYLVQGSVCSLLFLFFFGAQHLLQKGDSYWFKDWWSFGSFISRFSW